MTRILSKLSITALTLLLCGFGINAHSSSTETTRTAEKSAQTKPGTPVEFAELHSGNFPDTGVYTEKHYRVLSSQREYENALLMYTSDDPTQVDFHSNRVLLADMGQQNSSGYRIEVTSVERRVDHVLAHVTLSQPGPNCMTMQMLTNPYQFVRIRSADRIEVKETLAVYRCQ